MKNKIELWHVGLGLLVIFLLKSEEFMASLFNINLFGTQYNVESSAIIMAIFAIIFVLLLLLPRKRR